MKLSSLIPENLVVFGESALSKAGAIDLLLDAVCRSSGSHPDRGTMRESILERESRGSTTFPTGVAIPHGRVESLDDCIIAVYVPRAAFLDGVVPVRMVFLILTSPAGSSLYLKTLAAIAKVAKDDNLFSSLAAAGSSGRFKELLERSKVEVDRPPVVSDLMDRRVDSLPPTTTVRALIDLFQKDGRRWAAVTGPSGEFLGEISLFEVMGKAMPNYSTYMENLSFMPALRPLEALLEKESEIPVGALAVKPPVILEPGSSVIDAAFELVRHHRGSAPVVERGKIVGILGLADVLLGYMRG